MIITATTNSIVRIGDREFPFQRPWDGRPLTNRGFLALDTETEAIDDINRRTPRLALATASAGDMASAVIHPDQVGRFILAHPRARYVFHNIVFDFAVIDHHLQECGEEEARQAWWDACEANRMHDTMILDQLIGLARRDAEPRPRNLADVGREYARMEISKEDPFRLRFGELIGADWAGVEDGFFEYAVKDVIVTLHAFRAMLLEAQRLMVESTGAAIEIDQVLARYGALSEFIQVKGAIALSRIERYGMHVDLDRVRTAEAALRAGLEASVTDLRAMCPELFKTGQDPATGETILCRTRSGAPSISEEVLRQQLQAVIDEVRETTGRELVIPTTERTGKLQTSAKVWAEHAHLHPFVEKWLAVKDQSKLCQFFAAPAASRSSTRGIAICCGPGRTGCSRPNIQQIPRDGQFRQAFVPAPGHFLLAVDFSFIELRTLAAHCLKVYGRSELAERHPRRARSARPHGRHDRRRARTRSSWAGRTTGP